MATVAYLTSDLLFQSRVSSAASAIDVRLVADRNPDKLIAKLTEVADVQMLIVDLTLEVEDLGAIVVAFKSHCPMARTVAYGPHVHEAKLQRAVEAGFEQVMTRGQFDRQMNALLASCSGGE
ncbi:MAG: histidine kinase [Pirellulaceae bacterium]|nr:histidine kinase [Pirellulaceae bacterium]